VFAFVRERFTPNDLMSLPIRDDAAPMQPGIPLAPLAGVLDNIDQGIVLLASDSYPCFTNSAAERILSADAERGDIAREMRSVSRAALTDRRGQAAEVEVATREGRYRMRARILVERIREIRTRAVLVTIERAAAHLPSRPCLMQRFGMTAREADVALLLARGKRNTAIAEELMISTHTARHHTESVLSKLSLHTRAEVSRAIVDGFETKGARER
jgi:DNA-binding CsgD family transcriptional regulator